MKGMPNDWLLEGLEKSGQILDLVLPASRRKKRKR